MLGKPRGETIEIVKALGELSSGLPDGPKRDRLEKCIDAIMDVCLDELEIRIKDLAEFNRAVEERAEATRNQEILDKAAAVEAAATQAESDEADAAQREERSRAGIS